jgi:uncharacterized membrane protein
VSIPLWCATVFIVATAAWVRLYNLGGPSLWRDEAFSWWIAKLPHQVFLEGLGAIEVHPPAYFVGLRLAITLFGQTEPALRGLSAAADMAAVVLAMILGRQVAGTAGQLSAGWFWAFHPMTIWYAREARPYSLAALLACLLLVLYQRLRNQPSRANWSLAFATVCVGMLTHYYFLLVAGSIVLLTLEQMKTEPGVFRRWSALMLAAGIPLAVWIAWYFTHQQPSLGIGWIGKPGIADPLLTMANLLSGYAGAFSPTNLIYGLVALVLCGLACFRHGRSREARRVTLLGIALPIVAVWLVSQRRPIYMDRHFIVLLPYVTLLVAMGAQSIWEPIARAWSRLGPRVATSAVLAGMVALGVWSAWQVQAGAQYVKEDWRGFVEFVEQGPSTLRQVWLSDPEAIVPLDYYARGGLATLPGQAAPRCAAGCWWVYRQPYTATHAFAQGVSSPERPWRPTQAEGCSVTADWSSASGLEAWLVMCH